MQNIIRGVVYTLVVVMAFFCAEQSQAETFKEKLRQMNPEERAELQTRVMQQAFNLNVPQYTAVYEINLKHAKEAQPLIEKRGSRRRDRRKMRSLNQRKNKELKTVLTAKQYELYERKKKDIREEIKLGITAKTSH